MVLGDAVVFWEGRAVGARGAYCVFHRAWAAFTFSWAVWSVKGGLWVAIMFFCILVLLGFNGESQVEKVVLA